MFSGMRRIRSRLPPNIVANPVRAGLVKSVTDYPYSGSSLYSLQELAESGVDRI